MPAAARPHKRKNLNANPITPHSLAHHHNPLLLQSSPQVHHTHVPVDEPLQKIMIVMPDTLFDNKINVLLPNIGECAEDLVSGYAVEVEDYTISGLGEFRHQ